MDFFIHCLTFCFPTLFSYGALKNYAQGGDESKKLGSGEYLGLAGVSGK